MSLNKDVKPNPNPNDNRTTKHHAIVSIRRNIVTCPTHPEKFIRDDVIALFLLLSVVIVTPPSSPRGRAPSGIPPRASPLTSPPISHSSPVGRRDKFNRALHFEAKVLIAFASASSFIA